MSDVVEIKVETAKPYSLWVGAGILEQAGTLLPVSEAVDHAVLVADAAAMKHLGDRATVGIQQLCSGFEHRTVAGGESAKTMARAEELLSSLAESGLHRTDLLVSLGGGAVGDLAGFVAALYHRGMPLVHMPTTLLAQVDASIGGKTAVNLPEGKNLVGVFHQPIGVIADVTALASLPAAEFISGSAEVVKHGFIDDPEILEILEGDAARIASRDGAALVRLVSKAAAVKARAVARDETEQASRAFLNYGHTLGHALEQLGGYAQWRHGEAVAIGMMFAAHLAKSLGFVDLVDVHSRSIESAGLPVRGAVEPFERVRDAMTRDKKYRHGMRFVILKDLAEPALVSDVSDEVLRHAYSAVSA